MKLILDVNIHDDNRERSPKQDVSYKIITDNLLCSPVLSVSNQPFPVELSLHPSYTARFMRIPCCFSVEGGKTERILECLRCLRMAD